MVASAADGPIALLSVEADWSGLPLIRFISNTKNTAAIGYWLPATGYRLTANGSRLTANGYKLLPAIANLLPYISKYKTPGASGRVKRGVAGGSIVMAPQLLQVSSSVCKVAQVRRQCESRTSKTNT